MHSSNKQSRAFCWSPVTAYTSAAMLSTFTSFGARFSAWPIGVRAFLQLPGFGFIQGKIRERIGVPRIYFEVPLHQGDGLSVCWLGTVLLARRPAIGISQVASVTMTLGFEFYRFFEHARRVGMMAGIKVNDAKIGKGQCVGLDLE